MMEYILDLTFDMAGERAVISIFGRIIFDSDFYSYRVKSWCENILLRSLLSGSIGFNLFFVIFGTR